MKNWFTLAGAACALAVAPCLAGSAGDAGNMGNAAMLLVPAVVTPAVVAIPTIPQAVPAVPAPPALENPEEPPPPPEPPDADAAEPRRLVRYFCKSWKDKDYERMWWAMTPQYRKKVSLKKFKKLFESDEELNGGLRDENILEEGDTRKGGKSVKTELIFRFPRAKHRIVAAETVRQPGGAFRIGASPLIPLDLEDL